jgi:N-acetylglucosamine transport system substrate-binding protein
MRRPGKTRAIPFRMYVILLALLVLAACSKTQDQPDQAGTRQMKKDFAKKELNVAVFEGGQSKDYWIAVIQKFENDYPGIKVNLISSPKIMEILKPQIVTGNPPDFIYVPQSESTQTIKAMMEDKLLLDLTEVFEDQALDEDIPLKSKLIDGILEYAKPMGDGKMYYAPLHTSSLGLIYNKNLFEEKGWKVPETWDEFMELGEIAKEDGRSLFTYQGIYAGYNESVFWPAVASQGGMEAIRKTEHYEPGAFKTEAVRRTMELYEEIARKGYLMPGTVALNHIQAQADFLQGKALFIPCGTWIENEMKDSPRENGFEFGFLPPPVFKKGDKPYVTIFFDSMYIPAKAKNIELAKEFLKYQYKEDVARLNAEKTKNIVALKNGAEIAKPYISSVFYDSMKIMEHGVIPIIHQWRMTPRTTMNINDDLWDTIGHIMDGTATVEQWQEKLEKTSAALRELSS